MKLGPVELRRGDLAQLEARCSVKTNNAPPLPEGQRVPGQVLKSPEAMRPPPRPPRGSKLDPYAEHIDRRMGEGLENCRVLDREVRALGYQGSYSTVAQYVRRGGSTNSLRKYDDAV